MPPIAHIMKLTLVFEMSNDVIPFEVKYNHDLIDFFVNKSNQKLQNSFFVDKQFSVNIDSKISELHWAITKTNEIMYDLIDKNIIQQTELINYLDQNFLNKTHSDWVFSQIKNLNIDELRYSTNKSKSRLGNLLHELYPDEIQIVKTGEAMQKLGYIFPYEEINMGIHRLENSFSTIEFKADSKWEIFDNPFVETMITNNDVINFSFGYTYVGRQYYNKFKFFDLDLNFLDNYNYETLEFAFQINLNQPETIPFSHEAINWAKHKNIKLVAEQIPIGNAVDIDKKLFEYRKILYNNIKQGNRAKLILG